MDRKFADVKILPSCLEVWWGVAWAKAVEGSDWAICGLLEADQQEKEQSTG